MTAQRVPFPAEQPRSLTDPDVIREHDWVAFRQVADMTSHWDRPGWRPGRASYHWMVLTRPDPQLLGLIQQAQAALSGHPGLDPIAPEGIHLTVSRIGWTDEVSPAQAAQVAAAGTARCAGLRQIDVEVGPLAGSTGAIRFSVSPWHRLLELHSRLRTATMDVLGERAAPALGVFRPHLGIAYSNRRQPAAPLVRAAARLRHLAPVPVLISAVELVRLERAANSYLVSSEHTVVLAPARSAKL